MVIVTVWMVLILLVLALYKSATLKTDVFNFNQSQIKLNSVNPSRRTGKLSRKATIFF